VGGLPEAVGKHNFQLISNGDDGLIQNLAKINESNYMIGIDVGNLPRPTMSWLQTKYHNKIFHFTSSKGSNAKLKDMLYWNERFPPRS
jgi:hypothetical protein